MFYKFLVAVALMFVGVTSSAQQTNYACAPQVAGNWNIPCTPNTLPARQDGSVYVGQNNNGQLVYTNNNGGQQIGQVIGQPQQCPGVLVQTQFGLQCRIPQGSQFAGQALQGGVGGFSKCQVVGAGLGAVIGSLAHHHRNQAIVAGALLGGIAGDVVCSQDSQVPPMAYNPQQQFPQQVTQQGNSAGGQVCAPPKNPPGTRPARVTRDGHPEFGRTVCAPAGDPDVTFLN